MSLYVSWEICDLKAAPLNHPMMQRAACQQAPSLCSDVAKLLIHHHLQGIRFQARMEFGQDTKTGDKQAGEGWDYMSMSPDTQIHTLSNGTR